MLILLSFSCDPGSGESTAVAYARAAALSSAPKVTVRDANARAILRIKPKRYSAARVLEGGRTVGRIKRLEDDRYLALGLDATLIAVRDDAEARWAISPAKETKSGEYRASSKSPSLTLVLDEVGKITILGPDQSSIATFVPESGLGGVRMNTPKGKLWLSQPEEGTRMEAREQNARGKLLAHAYERGYPVEMVGIATLPLSAVERALLTTLVKSEKTVAKAP